MPISFNKYIRITSAVGGASAIPRRELIARLITESENIPVDTVIEFTSLQDVATRFSTTSEEYLKASAYFSFISKTATSPQRISMIRWPKIAIAAYLLGTNPSSLASLQEITAGTLNFTLNNIDIALTGLDFSGAADLAAIATILQTAIQAASADTIISSATVTYNATETRFEFLAGEAIDAVFVAPTGTVVDSLGWSGNKIVISNGSSQKTITQTLTDLTQISNNFGSFVLPRNATSDEIMEAAQWNAATDQNLFFQFHYPVTETPTTNPLLEIEGSSATHIYISNNQYPEMLPTAILAATDYSRANAVQNYMFQQTSLTPTVTTTAISDSFDELRINYYGQTQSAGQQLSFYQRGVMNGLLTAPVNQNTYANEQWLKAEVAFQLGNLLLGVSRVPANDAGITQLSTVIQSVTTQARVNGTISVGRPLTATQIAFITQVTNDPDAYRQIQSQGFWLNVTLKTEEVGGVTQYIGSYILLYTKDDVVRKIQGSHDLI